MLQCGDVTALPVLARLKPAAPTIACNETRQCCKTQNQRLCMTYAESNSNSNNNSAYRLLKMTMDDSWWKKSTSYNDGKTTVNSCIKMKITAQNLHL